MALRGRSQLVESFVWLVSPARIDRLIALSLSLVVHGRSSFVESFVWFLPFLCALGKRKEKREEKEKRGKRIREREEKEKKKTRENVKREEVKKRKKKKS